MAEIIINGLSVDGAVAAASGVTARVNSGATTVKRPRVNLISGANITIGIFDDGVDDEIELTISSSATSFPGFYGSTPAQDSGAGSAGASGLAARGDHVHPASAAYRPSTYRTRTYAIPVTGSGALSVAPLDHVSGTAFTPRLLIGLGEVGGGVNTVIGACIRTTGLVGYEACVRHGGGVSQYNTGFIFDNAGNSWSVAAGAFNSAAVTAARIAGASTYNGAWFIVGDD